ncbi:cyclase-associated protein 1-like [Impatiens glandulifera]|uniref:cyclase-associated protein 1-like n=1 Tax=Impatiens glandulifera TaxID=253017 RepID=UPI001FB18EFB|nr:cyclase-associated protein 1-like [Impatiens glandulifera]
MEKLIERLESAVVRLEAHSSRIQPRGFPETGGDDCSTDPSIIAFGDLITQSIGRLLTTAEKIGGNVLDVTQVLAEAFSVQKDLVSKIKRTPKPDSGGMSDFLKPLNDVITKCTRLCEGKRCDNFNHLKAVSDSLTALAWIAFSGKNCGMAMPIAHVEESWQAAEFYNNKILVEYKSKDPNHLEWAKSLKELYVPDLRDYVKTYYPLGPVWSTTASIGGPGTGAGAGSAPAPPPSAAFISKTSSSSSSQQPKAAAGGAGMGAVFQDISSGKSVTAGLRKVTDDMKTKNRTDNKGLVEKERGIISSPRVASKVGPAKLELQMGRKWVVENQIGNKSLVIEECDSKQSIYVYGCKDSVLQVKGKVNNITVDKCTKMSVVFMDVVAAFEIVNSNSLEVQCQGSAPTISIDNTSGCQLYLSKESLETSISTAKSSEINLLVPGPNPDDDWPEHPLPYQFIHVYKDGQFLTTPASHSGA